MTTHVRSCKYVIYQYFVGNEFYYPKLLLESYS